MDILADMIHSNFLLSTQEPKEEPQEPVLQECEQGKGQEQVEEPTTQEEEQVPHRQGNS